ncbi:MAG: hypothetical protein AAGD13_08370 [Pseudomonadota bacterium]
MNFELFLIDRMNLVFMRTSGRVDLHGLMETQRFLAEETLLKSSLDVLIDAREIDFSIRAEQVISAGRALRASRASHDVKRLAIVVKDDLAFGITRMFMVFRQIGNEYSVHRTIPLAIEWLGLPAAAEEAITCQKSPQRCSLKRRAS